MLQMLVRIELMRGNYLVALKYITLLEKTVHYAGWATAQRRFCLMMKLWSKILL